MCIRDSNHALYVLHALHPAGNAARAVDLLNGALLKLRQSSTGQLAFQPDEPSFIAADDIRHAVRPIYTPMLFPKENVAAQRRKVLFDRCHNISFQQIT